MGALRKLRRKTADYDVAPLRSRKASSIEQKVSDVILEFAEPLLEYARNERSFKTMVGFAIACWDVALRPEEEQEKSICDAIHRVAKEAGDDPETAAHLETVARVLLARKKAIYPNDRRIILNYEFVEEGDSTQLIVTFAMEAPLSTPGPQ